MSTRRAGRHTPRGIPIMDFIDVPSDLPAPLTTRPLLSRTKSLARSQTTSRTNSRASPNSSSSANIRSRLSMRKMMESGPSTIVKREDNGSRNTTPSTSTSLPRATNGKEKRFVPSSESPEPMDFHLQNHDEAMAVDMETQESISTSQGAKRKRSPSGDLEIGGSGTQPVPESGTGSPSSPEPDMLDIQLRDELGLADEQGPVSRLLSQASSTNLAPDEPRESGQSSSMTFAGGSGARPDIRSDASMKREPEGPADLDTSQADREDRMRVWRMLEEFADLPINPIASSSSRPISHGANSSHASASGPTPHEPQESGQSSSMGFAGGSGTTPDTRSSASMKREPEGTADLDTSQTDREDRIRVQRLLEEFADLPLNPIASSSSRRVSHGATSSRSSESPSPPPKRDKGKYRARAKSARPSGPPNPTDIIDITDSPPTPYQTLSTATRQFSSKGKQKAETVDLSSFSDDDTRPGGSSTEVETDNGPQKTTTNNQTAEDESHLSSYTCPICFCAPTNATLTPCGHICCGECLFTAIKTTQQRVAVIGPAEDARCPVCRAVIPGWDGKGGGVFGLKIRAVFSL